MKSRVKAVRNVISSHTPRRAGGFSLIELMIAMLLGLIVIAGVTSVFLANMSSYNTNQALSEVQDGARTAFELMSRDMRQAGLTGCSEGETVINALNNGTTLWYADWSNASGNGGTVNGYDAGTTDAAVTTGTAAGNRLATSPSLHLMGASSTTLSLASDDQNAGTFTLNETTATVPTGTIMMVCSPDHGAIVQITGQAGAVLHHAVGTTPSPGNCVKGLGAPSGCIGNQDNYQTNAMISPLEAADWYLGPNGAGTGTNSLYRLSPTLDGGGNVITTAPAEIVRNVTEMDIAYLLSGGTSFVSAATVAGNWGNVTAIQVTLKLESTSQNAGTGSVPITRTFVSTTSLRNRLQ